MQLFARNSDNDIISASEALKGKAYFCLECSGALRVRGGRERRCHFYHLAHNRLCRQSGKSLVHLQVQCSIRDALPLGEGELEKRFDAIGRIGDVVWERKKLIFEVQCSAITAEEIKERNSDYQALGYRVIWILHDRRYNKRRLTAAEEFLQEAPHYFTNIDEMGRGEIYDQIASIDKGSRGFSRLTLPIAIALPCCFESTANPSYSFLRRRHLHWHTYFKGDAFDAAQSSPLEEEMKSAFEALDFEELKFRRGIMLWGWPKLLVDRLALVYQIALRMVIEKACRR